MHEEKSPQTPLHIDPCAQSENIETKVQTFDKNTSDNLNIKKLIFFTKFCIAFHVYIPPFKIVLTWQHVNLIQKSIVNNNGILSFLFFQLRKLSDIKDVYT